VPRGPLATAAVTTAVLALALLLAGAVLGLTHPPGAQDFPEVELGFGAAFGGLALAGALAARAQPRNPVGLVLALASLAFVLPVASGEYAVHALGRGWPAGEPAAWLSAWPPPVAYALLVVALPVLFPSGEVPRGWRVAGPAVAAAAVLAAAALAVRPGRLEGLVEIDNPYAVGALRPVADVVAGAAPPLVALAGLVALGGLLRRAWRSTAVERAQFRVVGLALALLLLALLGQLALGAAEPSSPGLLGALRLVGFLAVPAALAVAMTRYRLYELDRIVDRAVVFGLVSAGVVVLYVCAVALLGGALGTRVDLGASVLAAVVAAVAFPLLRDGVQRLVARRLYGWRDDPYAVLAGLGGRLDGLQPTRVLDGAVAELRAALRLPWVAVRDADERLLASSGTQAGGTERLPLSWQGTPVGWLEVSPRAGERRLPERDHRLLTDAAVQLAGAVRAADLAAELQLSRERLVRAREEERRRLRRDLHDGLGPVLTGVALGLDGVAALVPRDPDAAVALARKVRSDAESAVAEVRRVVHDLRPPALDQLGLVPALAQRAEALSTSTTRMAVGAGELPPLDAAVEVACYAVAVEAMTNVARHAAATTCQVSLVVEGGRLLLDVSDDGSGTHGPQGVGTASSRERALELGGDVEVVATPGKGTVVRLSLPLAPAA
jgi:signal transduction histidine kinase